MNLFLALLRRISFGGVVVFILSIFIKGGVTASGNLKLFLLASPILYLVFVFFSWLSAKNMTSELSEQLGVDIPSNNYVTTLIRAFFIDIISPIEVIINLFRNKETGVVMFIGTYLVIAGYAYLWFFKL